MVRNFYVHIVWTLVLGCMVILMGVCIGTYLDHNARTVITVLITIQCTLYVHRQATLRVHVRTSRYYHIHQHKATNNNCDCDNILYSECGLLCGWNTVARSIDMLAVD